MAERGTGRYVGSAFITLNREQRERLWKRVQDHAGTSDHRHSVIKMKGDMIHVACDEIGSEVAEVPRFAKAVIEAECAERAAKTARLKSLRMAQILQQEPSFNEELDCSALIAALTQERICSAVAGCKNGRPYNGRFA